MKNKIMVVDDKLGIVGVVKKWLKANHYEVITAKDGVDAFVKASDEKPDLIILDAFMPAMDGMKFLQAARAFELKNIPVLVLTALRNIKEPFRTLGVGYFLTEPFDSKELLGKVDEAISSFSRA